MDGDNPENSLSAGLDLNSVQKLTEAIDAQGVPDLQVVYFPGIDIFTHVSKDRLERKFDILSRLPTKRWGRYSMPIKPKARWMTPL